MAHGVRGGKEGHGLTVWLFSILFCFIIMGSSFVAQTCLKLSIFLLQLELEAYTATDGFQTTGF